MINNNYLCVLRQTGEGNAYVLDKATSSEKLWYALYPDMKELYTSRKVYENLYNSYMAVLGDLNERMKTVILLRYGLQGNACTIEETARKIGDTKDATRMLEARALRNMRSPYLSCDYICNADVTFLADYRLYFNQDELPDVSPKDKVNVIFISTGFSNAIKTKKPKTVGELIDCGDGLNPQDRFRYDMIFFKRMKNGFSIEL